MEVRQKICPNSKACNAFAARIGVHQESMGLEDEHVGPFPKIFIESLHCLSQSLLLISLSQTCLPAAALFSCSEPVDHTHTHTLTGPRAPPTPAQHRSVRTCRSDDPIRVGRCGATKLACGPHLPQPFATMVLGHGSYAVTGPRVSGCHKLCVDSSIVENPYYR